MAQTVVTKFDADTKGLTSKVDKATGKVKKNIKGVETATTKLNGAFKALGAAFTAGFALQKAAQAFTFILNTTKNFEAQMARVKAITGAAGQEFQKLTEDAKRLGESTKFTATEVGQLQEAYGKLGFSTKEILDATEATLLLAIATGESLSGSAEVAGSTLRAFGLDASETGRVVDVMARSFTSSALDLEGFRESMKLVAPIARAANIPIETTTALLGTLADAGLKGSIAGTSLKNLLSKLGDESSDLSKELGFTVKNTDDLFRAFQELKKGNIDLTKATELTDERSKAAFLTLINGVDNVEALTEALDGAKGAAQEMADIIEDTLQGDINRFNSAVEGLALTLGEGENGLASTFRDLTKAMTSYVGFVNKTISSNDGLSKSIRAVFTAIVTREIPVNSLREAIVGLFSDTAEGLEELSDATDGTREGFAEMLGTVFAGMDDGGEKVISTLEELKKRLGDVRKEMINQALAGKVSTSSLNEYKLITEQLAAAQKIYDKAIGKTTDKVIESTATEKSVLEALREEIGKLSTEMQEQAAMWGGVFPDSLKKYNILLKQLTDAEFVYNEAVKNSRELTAKEKKKIATDEMSLLRDMHAFAIDLEVDEKDLLAEFYASDFKTFKEFEEFKRAEIEKTTALEITEGEKRKKAALQALQVASDLVTTISDFQSAARDKELAQLEEQKEFELELAGSNEARREEIEDKFAKKKADVLKKAAEREKIASLFQIAIATAVNAVTLFAATIPPGILSAIAVAFGLAQAALVLAKPIPQFAEGTPFVELSGNKRGRDTVPAMLSEGERVIPTKQNRKHWGLYNAIDKGMLESYILKNYVNPQLKAENFLGGSFAENVGKHIKIQNKFTDRKIVTELKELQLINRQMLKDQPRFNARKI